MHKMIFGFDPGNSSGAAVHLRTENNEIKYSRSLPFPVIQSKKSTGRTSKELDLDKVYDWFVENLLVVPTSIINEPYRLILVCEKVTAMPKQGCVSVFSFGDGFGQIKGLCRTILKASEAKGQFILVRPQEWKATILKGTPKDKGAGEQYIKDRYPQIDLHCNRNGKPHLGVVDAACIALYGLHNS